MILPHTELPSPRKMFIPRAWCQCRVGSNSCVHCTRRAPSVCRRTVGTVVITQWNFGVEFRGVEKWNSYFVVPGWYKSKMVHLSFQEQIDGKKLLIYLAVKVSIFRSPWQSPEVFACLPTSATFSIRPWEKVNAIILEQPMMIHFLLDYRPKLLISFTK